MSDDETFDVWPHDPEGIVREALREYVGDGDGEDENVLAAYDKVVGGRIAQAIEAADSSHVLNQALLPRMQAARIAREAGRA